MTYYIGLGCDCYIADFMQKANLRSFSFPFDWMFAYPCTVKRSLDKDFSDWLNPQYLTVMDNPKRNDDKDSVSTKHDLYHDHMDDLDKKHDGFLHVFFNHHDVLSDAGKKMFERRIERYKSVINSSEYIVFLTNSNIDDLESAGLLDYYKDRKGKTIIVCLKLISNRDMSPKYIKYKDYYVIEFGHTGDWSDDNMVNKISQKLIKHFGSPNLKDPLGLEFGAK